MADYIGIPRLGKSLTGSEQSVWYDVWREEKNDMVRRKAVLAIAVLVALGTVLLFNPVPYAAHDVGGPALAGDSGLDYRWGPSVRPPPPVGRGQPPLELALPFDGYGYVTQGNNDGAPSHKGDLTYAWDFVKLGNDWMSFRSPGARMEDYYTWGLAVRAPAAGKIVRVLDYISDNPLGEENRQRQSGNFLIIKHAEGLYSQIDHFKRLGIVVKLGDWVERGQVIGYAGNSGWSLQPHIHYQLQDGSYPGAQSLPSKFAYYVKVDRMGEYSVRLGVPVRGDILRNGPWPRPPSED